MHKDFCDRHGANIVSRSKKITSSDLTLKLLIYCDRREWISVENHFLIKPCLLRRWIGTNALQEICPQFLPELPWSYCSWSYLPRSPRSGVATTCIKYMFLMVYFIPPKSNGSVYVKTIPFPLIRTSLLWGGLFSDAVICWLKL